MTVKIVFAWTAMTCLLPACSAETGQVCEGRRSVHDPVPGKFQLPSGNIRIAPEDAAGILAISRSFAAKHGFGFQSNVEYGGFKLQMNKGRMVIHAHNRDCLDLAKIRIWDGDDRHPGHFALAGEYMELLYRHSSVPQFPYRPPRILAPT